MKKIIPFFFIFIFLSCCKKYPVPPIFEFEPNSTFGFVQTKVVNSDSTVSSLITGKLIEYLTYEQKGSFIELGSFEKLLKEYNSSEYSSDIIKKIGKDYNLKSVVLSEIEFSDIAPNFSINIFYPSFYAKVKLTASLHLKIFETLNGSIIYIKTIQKKTELSNVYISKNFISFDSKTYDQSQYDLIDELVWKITKDFRTTYKCR